MTKKDFSNCWELMECGMGKTNRNPDAELECPASKLDLGHSCWLVAGVLHHGAPFCPRVNQGDSCFECKIYKLYSRSSGQMKKDLEAEFPEECKMYNKMMSERNKKRKENEK